MKRMREIRRASGKTIEKCAQEAGVQVQRWLSWERVGWVRDRDTAITISRVLETSLDDLADNRPSSAPAPLAAPLAS